MLIPSIDLQAGRIVQLVQGERLALASDDVDGWIARFARFPKVQLIDLDAAMAAGDNDALVRRICARLPCRVGGGVRSVERAQALLAAGATAVIAGSALFGGGRVSVEFAGRLAESVGGHRVISAVDSRGGHVVVKGWTERTPLATVDAVRALEPYCAEFLYTHVDTEGLMTGIDMDAVRAVRAATSRRVTAAGGIRSREEIERLDALGVDAVVGMAIYTGAIDLERW
jgi:phosphoribosylformimino-5-aminoimidazole carboxamide ribotide isomerase